jgi:hypothetical protein
MRRTFPIDASAHAVATAPATSRIVRIDIETSTVERPMSLVPEEDSAAVTCSSYRPERTPQALLANPDGLLR